MHRKALVIM